MMANRKNFSLENLFLRWGEAGSEKKLDFRSFSEQINLIKGANASGKSTTAKAIKQLIWKNEADRYIHQSAISAGAKCGGDTWRFSWKYGTDSISQNGVSANRTALSAGTQPDRYYLSLQNLLSEDDSELARSIYNEMLGGYDLEQAKDELGFSGNIKNRSISEYRDLEDAIKKETELRQKFDRLSDDEKKLEQLKTKKAELDSREKRHTYLDNLEAYLSIEKQLKNTEQQLNQFDSRVRFNQMSGEEWKQLDELQHDISGTAKKLGELENDLVEVNRNQNTQELPATKPKLSIVRKWKSQADDLSNMIKKLDQQKARLEGKREELKTHRKALNDLVQENGNDEWIEPEYEFWDKLENKLSNVLEKNIQRKNLQQQKKWLADKRNDLGTPASSDELSELFVSLKQIEPVDSINHADQKTSARIPVNSVYLILGLLLAAVIAGAFIHWAIALIAVLLAGVAIFLLARSSGQNQQTDPFSIQKEKITSSSLVTLDDWSADSLDAGIKTILEKKQKRSEYDHLNDEIGQLEEKIKAINEDLHELEYDLKQLTKPYGNFPEFESGAAFFQYLNRWNQVHKELASCRNEEVRIKELEQQILENKEQLINSVSEYVEYEQIPKEFEKLTIWLIEFEDDLELFNELENKKQSLKADINHKKNDLERLKSEKDKLFELFPEDAELTDIKTWCNQLDRFTELTEQKGKFLSQKQLKEQEIVADPKHKEDDFSKTLPDIEHEKKTIENEISQIDGLENEIKRIDNELYKVKSSHDLQDARLQTEQAWSGLMERKQENLFNITGHLLYSTLKQHARLKQTPELLEQANHWFNQFTNGMYRLQVSSDSNGNTVPEFQAQATETGTFFNIDQLSSGTRIQLLLAVRLAYIEHQEGEVKLPLIIDELLANSDDQRAQQIIHALIAIAENGRQIFYFTAQSDEVIKWMRAADSNTVTIKEIAIGDAEASKTRSPDENHSMPVEIPNVVTNVPGPGTMDHAAYGEELGVPVFNPRQDELASLHLWYALEIKPLYRLLQLDISQWNQLSSLIESNADLPLENSLIERLCVHMPLVDFYLQLRRTGYPRQINEVALAESGAISDTFWEPVTKKLKECHYNPELLLQAIEQGEILRFRKDKMDELREYLYEEGYLKHEVKLSSEEIDQELKLHLAKQPNADRSFVQKIINRIEHRFSGT